MASTRSSTSASKAGPCVVQQGTNDTFKEPTRKQAKNAARIDKRSPIGARKSRSWVLNLTIDGIKHRFAPTRESINLKHVRLDNETTFWLYETFDQPKPLLLAGANLAAMTELEAATNATTIEDPIANNEQEKPVLRLRFQRRRLNGKDRI